MPKYKGKNNWVWSQKQNPSKYTQFVLASHHAEWQSVATRNKHFMDCGEYICSHEDSVLSRIGIRLKEKEKDFYEEDDIDDIDDVIVRRRTATRSSYLFLTIYHDLKSTVFNCGFQLWPASLLLADYLIANQEAFHENIFFEMGCGIGFLGCVLSLMKHRGAFITDIGDPILQFASRNLAVNAHLSQSSSSVQTRVFDWKEGSKNFETFDQTDLNLLKQFNTIFIAADVVYDDDLTNLLFESLLSIMKKKDIFLVSLDLRYNFTIDDMTLKAHGYQNFLRIVRTEFKGVQIYHDCANNSGPSPWVSHGFDDSQSALELWRIVRLDHDDV